MGRRVLIAGSRDFAACASRVYDELDWRICDDDVIVHGGARGIDSLAQRYAEANELETEVWPADWDTHGKKAGFLRNKNMVDSKPDVVIVFWNGYSKGTFHTMTLAHKAGIQVMAFHVQ